ncbi:hypothetical protein CLOM_g10051 [Closterium sp. NIES-68]|nr:hypothetical protein CLOM_g10051 [Closterium sp. NIES-68]GJP58766.1 hypothetical protein CLOP_g3376 [Closterium sp. NIES-67]
MTSAPPIVAYSGGISGLKSTAVGIVESAAAASRLDISRLDSAVYPGAAGTSSSSSSSSSSQQGGGGAGGGERKNLRPLADSPRVKAYQEHLHSTHKSVLASVGAAEESSLVYSYGFLANSACASLTAQQAKNLESQPGVGQVVRAKGRVRAFTTYTPKYMKMGKAWSGVGGKGRAGEDVIIGVIDSGIWPEHPSFSDKGYGPVPRRWKGACTGLRKCNRKVIGARYFLKGYEAEYGPLAPGEYRSARDAGGHGTWCAGAAAGNSDVTLTEQDGTPIGSASGMAPRGRVAVYKALWYNASEGYGHDCDIFAAVDQAVADGVDVLSMSIGSGEDTYFGDLHLLRAMQAGVFVATAAGNDGPPPNAEKRNTFRTLSNAAPFYLTVAASSTDDDWVFFSRSAQSTQVNATSLPAAAAAAQPKQLSNPMMAPFSSAGPPLKPSKPPSDSPALTNDILKPDITAPGISRVAAAPGGTIKQAWYSSKSGTSMSTPQLAGIAALIIEKYPNWSPSAVKSAIMTTATVMNRQGGCIQDSLGVKASPWNYGSGHLNAPKILNPGLIYDVGFAGYTNFLAGLNMEKARQAFGDSASLVPIQPWNLNQPNICVSQLSTVVTVTRRVTSVAWHARTYKLRLGSMPDVAVEVSPKKFTILPWQSMTFSVTLTPKKGTKIFSFGSLAWVDGVHWVRTSIAAQPMVAL